MINTKYLYLILYFLISQILAIWFIFLGTGYILEPTSGGAALSVILGFLSYVVWLAQHTKFFEL